MSDAAEIIEAAANGELNPADSFNAILATCFDQDGNLIDPERYQHLMIVYEGWKADYEAHQQVQAENAALLAALNSVRDDRNSLALDVRRRVKAAKKGAIEGERQRIVQKIAGKYAIDEESAGYLLDFITGAGRHAINPYAERLLTETLSEATREIQDFVDTDEFYDTMLVEVKASVG